MKKMSGKMARAAVVRVVWCVCAVLALGNCQTLSNVASEPTVSFKSVSLTGIGFDGVDLLAVINVENNTPFTIPFPQIDWEFFVSDSSFLKGQIQNGTQIAKNSTSAVEIPLKVPYEGLYKTIATLVSADEAPYKVTAGFRFPLPTLAAKVFTAAFSGSIPMLKAPNLSFGGIKFNSLSLSKVEFTLDWKFENKNAFDVNLDKLDYRFRVNDRDWASGAAPADIVLPSKKTTPVQITVSLSSLSMIKDIVALAAGGKTVTYSCGGETALSPQGILKNAAALKLPFNYTGTTKLK